VSFQELNVLFGVVPAFDGLRPRLVPFAILLSFFVAAAPAAAQNAVQGVTQPVEAPLAVGDEQEDDDDAEYVVVTPPPIQPVGWTLVFAQTYGYLGRFQLGTAYWFNREWAVGAEIGFDYGRRQHPVVASNGQGYTVTRVTSTFVPQVYGMYTLATSGNKRLLLNAGIGPLFSKPEGEDMRTGLVAHLGPGVDWPLTSQLSLHLEQRIALVADPEPAVGLRIGYQPQFSVYWWF
jgi:hypothetical protein